MSGAANGTGCARRCRARPRGPWPPHRRGSPRMSVAEARRVSALACLAPSRQGQIVTSVVHFSDHGQTSAEGILCGRPTGRPISVCAKKPLSCSDFLLPRLAWFPVPCLPRDSRLYGTPPGLRRVGLPGSSEGSGNCVDGERPGPGRGRPKACSFRGSCWGASTASR